MSRRSFRVSSFLAGAVFLIVFFCGWAEGLGEEEYRRVQLARRELGKYRAYLPGGEEPRWQAEWVLERIEEGPPAVYTVRDEVRGEFGKQDLLQTRVTEGRFLLKDGRIRVERTVFTVSNPEEGVIRTLEKDFDHQLRVIRTVDIDRVKEKVRRKEFKMGREPVDTREIVTYLRGFPFPPAAEAEDNLGRRIEFTLLTESPEIYSVRAEYRGVEEVKTPAGIFSCHKLQLVPDLGILTFLGKWVAPDLYIWFAVEPPHLWVKYQGLEGDLKTPTVISELVDFQISVAQAVGL